MGLFSSTQPYTSISATVERLTARTDASEDAADILELIELIQIHPSAGLPEAGRALRKKLKHGSTTEQIRALQVTELVVDNGGNKLAGLVDGGLGDQIVATARNGESKPRKRAATLLRLWTKRPDRQLNGYYGQLGVSAAGNAAGDKSYSRRPVRDAEDRTSSGDGRRRARSYGENGAPRDDDRDRDRDRRRGRSESGTRKQRARTRSPSRSPSPINLRGASLTSTIATGHSVATRLTNSLILNGDEVGRSRETAGYFQQAKQLRRVIINLIHEGSAETDEYLDQLLRTNEELVEALRAHDAAIEGKLPVRRQAATADHENWDRGDLGEPENELLDLRDHRPPPTDRDDSPPPPARPLRPEQRTPIRGSEPHSEIEAESDLDPFADDKEDNQLPTNTPIW